MEQSPGGSPRSRTQRRSGLTDPASPATHTYTDSPAGMSTARTARARTSLRPAATPSRCSQVTVTPSGAARSTSSEASATSTNTQPFASGGMLSTQRAIAGSAVVSPASR